MFWYLLDQKQSSKESESSSWVLQKTKMIGNVREKQRDKRLIGLVLGLGSFYLFFKICFCRFGNRSSSNCLACVTPAKKIWFLMRTPTFAPSECLCGKSNWCLYLPIWYECMML